MKKKSRKSNGEGHMKQTESGRWTCTVMLGNCPVTGKRQRKSVTRDTKAEVQAEVRRLLVERDRGENLTPEKMTLRELAERYLELKSARVKPTTAKADQYAAEKLRPLYDVPLAKLKLMQADALSLQLQRDGVADAYVHRIIGILKSILEQGRKWGVVTFNWHHEISRPSVPMPTPNAYSRDEVMRFLSAAQGDRLYALFHLLVVSGMRRGELLGLHWDDIEFLPTGEADVFVRRNLVQPSKEIVIQEPKTHAARRRIRVGADTVAALIAHREQQLVELAGGYAWGNPNIVFASELGTYINTWRMYPLVRNLCKKAGIKYDGLHVFRRTSGSLLILEGRDAKAVSRRLGHTDVAFTLRTYQHVFDEQHDAAVLSFDVVPAPQPTGAPN